MKVQDLVGNKVTEPELIPEDLPVFPNIQLRSWDS